MATSNYLVIALIIFAFNQWIGPRCIEHAAPSTSGQPEECQLQRSGGRQPVSDCRMAVWDRLPARCHFAIEDLFPLVVFWLNSTNCRRGPRLHFKNNEITSFCTLWSCHSLQGLFHLVWLYHCLNHFQASLFIRAKSQSPRGTLYCKLKTKWSGYVCVWMCKPIRIHICL